MMSSSRECRCRCGCLLAKVSVPVTVSFDTDRGGVEIRCRRCKIVAVLVPGAPTPEPAERDAE